MKRLIYFTLLAIFSQVLLAQQNNTMYFMQTLPQNKYLNPSYQNECKLHVGGAAIPVTGQVFFPIYMNYGNNGFAFKDLIQYNGDMDSLILPGFKGYDWDALQNKLREVNYITMETHINWLTVGYKYKDWYFGIDVNDKVEARTSFNKDLITFIHEGNGNTFLNEVANLGDLGITATAYTEYALSASKKISDKLTVGMSAKLLFGKLNIWTEKSIIDVETVNSDNYPIRVNADMVVHTSQPFFEVTDMYYDYVGDSMVFESESYEPDFNAVYNNYKNFGLGVDLGAQYQFNDKIKLYASLIDLGYIKWKTNVQTFTMDGEYIWDGYNFQPALTEDEELITEHNDSLKHQIISIYEPEMQQSDYVSHLTPKAYLGGTYQFNDKIRTGLLLRGSFFQHAFHPSITLSGNFRLTNWFESTVSYSMINNSYTNVGIGFSAKAKWFQFFMMTDNVLGFIWPQATRNVNFRMGINLIFGCNKQVSKTLIN
ncbi:MAG: hypothetical protein JXR60_00035 [Bacteroidales bacterium]|nr:hypothetical protein [Bacteroidales bacterium]